MHLLNPGRFRRTIVRAIITASCLLVHPLRAWTRSWLSPSCSPPDQMQHALRVVLVGLICVGFPWSVAWGAATWGADSLGWGVFSGLAVGLQCASVTLKSWSFFHRSWDMKGLPGGTKTIGGEIATGRRGTEPVREASSSSRGRRRPENMGDKNGDVRHGTRAREEWSTGGDSTKENDRGAKGVSANDEVSPGNGHQAAADPATDLAAPAEQDLTFEEYAFFILCVPSLVCEPRLLRRGARLPPDVLGAASEFLNSGLTFLSMHVVLATLYAPVLRVLTAGLKSLVSWKLDGVAAAACAGAADGGGNALLLAVLCPPASPGPGYDLTTAGAAAGHCQAFLDQGCGDGRGLGEIASVGIAAIIGMLFAAPASHFCMFYAFFHCVCVGAAKLWGYPDRNFYGETGHSVPRTAKRERTACAMIPERLCGP